MCFPIWFHEQGHMSQTVAEMHRTNPHWGILWTLGASKSEKTRKVWRVDPHWTREMCQRRHRLCHPRLEPRETTQYQEDPEKAQRSPTASLFGLLQHVLRIIFVYLLCVIVCGWVGGACLSMHGVWGRSGPHRTCLIQKLKMLTFRHRSLHDFTQRHTNCLLFMWWMQPSLKMKKRLLRVSAIPFLQVQDKVRRIHRDRKISCSTGEENSSD